MAKSTRAKSGGSLAAGLSIAKLRSAGLGPILLLAVSGLLLGIGTQWVRAKRTKQLVRGVLPGEFERHEGLVLAWDHELDQEQLQTLAKVAGETCGHAQVLLLVNNSHDRRATLEMLSRFDVPTDAVRFVEAPFDFTWVRDYAPMVIKSFDGGYAVVDAVYSEDAETPPADDDAHGELAALLGMKSHALPLRMAGGNLLSNGAGLCVSTRSLLEINEPYGYREREVDALLQEYFGATTTVYLEYLEGETTNHVDMFATFTAPDSIVVGKYDAKVDPVNAAILDRNASRLRGIHTACGPLRVSRIPMPNHADGNWRTYTNVVFVNGVLLMPSYPDADAELENKAVETYQRLLPRWNVVQIDARALTTARSALHCAARSLYRIKP